MAYPVPALDKGLDILELFACEPGGLTKTEVARRLQHSVSEVFRPLLCLEKRGYIRKSEDGSFRLTLKLLTFLPAYLLAERLLTEALPVMQELSNRLGQSCYLGVLDYGRVTIIAHVDSSVGPAFSVKTGSVMDLVYTAMGRVFLAHVSDETRTFLIELWHTQHHRDNGLAGRSGHPPYFDSPEWICRGSKLRDTESGEYHMSVGGRQWRSIRGARRVLSGADA